MARPRVLVLGCAPPSAHGRDQMRRLHDQASRRDVELVGADLPESRGSVPPGIFDDFIELPVHDADACRSWAATTGPRFDAVLTLRELCVEPVAAISQQIKVKGNSPEAARLIRHKDLTRGRLAANGLPQPPWALADSVEHAVEFVRRTRPGPWVVKPRAGMGSEGVSRVERAEDIPQAVARLPGGTPYIVEAFVAGREYSAEGVLISGAPYVVAITEKFTTASFIEIGHRIPASLDGATDQDARRAVEKALVATGITCGIFHVEFWSTEDGVTLGELHARPGGDFIHALAEHACPGLELYGSLIDDLLDREPAALPGPSLAAGVDYLVLPPGVARSVHGWDDVARHPSVIAAELKVRPGDVVEPVRSSADRHGCVVAVGASRTSVDAVLTTLRRHLRIEIGAAG
jgi:hypothetical protein